MRPYRSAAAVGQLHTDERYLSILILGMATYNFAVTRGHTASTTRVTPTRTWEPLTPCPDAQHEPHQEPHVVSGTARYYRRDRVPIACMPCMRECTGSQDATTCNHYRRRSSNNCARSTKMGTPYGAH